MVTAAVQYKAVSGYPTEVGEKVTELLEKNWKLYGQPMVRTDGALVQVMIKQ